MNSVIVSNKQFDSDSVSTLDSSSWSWFEPLENIISSASSSSMGSPIGDGAVSASANAATAAVGGIVSSSEALVGGDMIAGTNITAANGSETTMFGDVFTNPSSYSNSPSNEFMSVEVKKEQQAEDFNLTGLVDAKSATQPQTLRKKRAPRKRLTSHQKQAHNKIEKRYRININTKIAKLQQIIPWVASEQTAFEVGDSVKRPKDEMMSDTTVTTTPVASEASPSICSASSTKLNKSMILEKAVDYILYLQNSERLYEMEVQRLKNELESLKKN